ncbi:SO2930 family diheme c-type cytochrome [Flavilitoribacter nigricans]|uniref:Uncharacterized protein n=1 Tax=Flavilitoribacter nigricans (strain ATCC 23147 / DSM 23189 / NBRC 102662 / NCIMB 1420 / SS-2) TaxID=1122177 RepID=A0A2D0N665_FLAN2|nr:SO2930 family diheme c-type cytochrome [Flavilitoribacter nigricans]PHN03866.1 hypothetical protein CRP01_25070 [Flavilitoribacter nigricans DSM 23189 = NBRC 102662]
MKKNKTSLILIILGMLGAGCGSQSVNVPQTPPEKLSAYGFFAGNPADLQPSAGVLPYDLNTPLFSDYAHKARFVWMPPGKSARYTGAGVLDFPEGTVLIKNFYYENDETAAAKGRRILETRLLIHRGENWEALGYIWDDAQTEAYLKVTGDIKEVAWVNKQGKAQQVNYIIPNKNQCKNCHARAEELVPIGPKVANLNRDFAYADGAKNQLVKWTEVGYLSGYVPEAEHPVLAAWDQPGGGDLQERALAYLDVNCGHCHHPEGAANTSGLTLTAGAKLDRSLGIFKPTVSAGAGTGGNTYSIVPGDPEASIMVYRMRSTDPGAMMPELGRRMVHEEGVALISDWIKSLELENPAQVSGAPASSSK